MSSRAKPDAFANLENPNFARVAEAIGFSRNDIIPAQAGTHVRHGYRPEFMLGPRCSADPWAGMTRRNLRMNFCFARDLRSVCTPEVNHAGN
jgi:hypothetical protein